MIKDDSFESKKDKNCNKTAKICLTGPEIVTLAGSIAICLNEKYCKDDLKKLKHLFSTICANISVIEHDKHD